MTAACLDRELAPMVFVKIVGRRSRRAIANEYAWLTRLSAVPEMRRRVPVPLRCWQIDGITALELRPLTSTRRAAVEWSDEHEWFIEQLQRCGDRHASVGERLPSRIERRLARLRSFISPALNRLLADAARDLQRTWHDQPPRVVAHGDFTPWNVMQAPDGIRVVDWESAAADCPPMYDYLHFQLFSRAVRRRMQRADLARLLQPSASARIRRWQGSPASASRQCLAYLLDVITAYLEADDGENEGSAVVQQYARMLSERAEWLR